METESTNKVPTCHPTGKWIVASNGQAFCSVCGRGLNAPLKIETPMPEVELTTAVAVEPIKPEPVQAAAVDMVNHPPHYTKGKFEVIDILEDLIQHYPDPITGALAWQVIKYLARAPHKNAFAEDTKKAGWYFDRLRTRLSS